MDTVREAVGQVGREEHIMAKGSEATASIIREANVMAITALL